MRLASVLVLMLATLTSCQKQPTSAPSQRGKFSVFTLAPENSDAKKFAWYVSGREKSLSQRELKEELTLRGRETDTGQEGWSEENNRSENMIGLRMDGRAPMHEFWSFVENMVECRCYRFAIALLQDFDPPSAQGGENYWEIDKRYLRHEIPTDESLAEPVETYAIGLNIGWDKTTARCTFMTRFEKDKREVNGVASRLEQLAPELSKGQTLNRAQTQGWTQGRSATASALKAHIESSKQQVDVVEIGQLGTIREAYERRADSTMNPPIAFLLLVLEAVAEMDHERDTNGRAAFRIRWSFHESRGGHSQWPPDPMAPEPQDD